MTHWETWWAGGLLTLLFCIAAVFAVIVLMKRLTSAERLRPAPKKKEPHLNIFKDDTAEEKAIRRNSEKMKRG